MIIAVHLKLSKIDPKSNGEWGTKDQDYRNLSMIIQHADILSVLSQTECYNVNRSISKHFKQNLRNNGACDLNMVKWCRQTMWCNVSAGPILHVTCLAISTYITSGNTACRSYVDEDFKTYTIICDSNNLLNQKLIQIYLGGLKNFKDFVLAILLIFWRRLWYQFEWLIFSSVVHEN